MALVVFTIYTLIVFGLAGVAYFVGSKKSFAAEYFLGSRGLGMLALALTFGATSASAGSFAGFPALIYSHGWILALWIASYMIFPLCGLGLLGKRINQLSRQTGAITLPELLRARFDSRAIAMLSTGLIAVLLTVYLIPQFKLAALIMEQMLADIPAFQQAASGLLQQMGGVIPGNESPEYFLCLIVFSVLVIVYTSLGGFRAVVWTDVLQGAVMVVGVIVMLFLALYQVGGLSKATSQLAEMTTPNLGEVVFEAGPNRSEGDTRIPADSWFVVSGPDESPRLFRTNQTAIIGAQESRSQRVPVVEITSPGEMDAIRNAVGEMSLPVGVRPVLGEMAAYVYGADKPGVYVSAPGPSATSTDGFLPLGLAVSFFVFWAMSGTGQPGNMVRLMAFDSSKTLKRAIASLSIYFSLIYFPLVIIFCCARILEPGMDQTPDRIMPAMAFLLTENAGIPWMAGLIIAAPFAAAMSTVDSFMLMISSSFVRDIYQREINPEAKEKTIKILSYSCTIGIGLIATIGAAYPPQFLQYVIVFSGGALASAFLGIVALGLYWPRFTRQGAIASMVGGFGMYLALYIAGIIDSGSARPYLLLGFDPLIWGFLVSLGSAYVVSLMGSPPKESLVRQFFYKG
ncbi:MAG: hypothetical protein KTR29_19335 [Rhodothermaceae bacterium]|nr:hypothetical protein [Rhodothermaceae bacterium]